MVMDEFFYGTLPQDTQDFSQVLRGVGRSIQDIGRGVSYYPYDLVGAPVDLINMALTPVGLGSERPVLGSDYLRNIAQSLGLAQPSTGSGTETAARFASALINPAAGARAVGKVGSDINRLISMIDETPPRGSVRIRGDVPPASVDDLVMQTTDNPQVTAQNALQIAGETPLFAGMTKPGLSWQGKKIPEVEKLAKSSDKFLYHSDTAENVENLQYGIEPQRGGAWIREVAEGAVDDVDELLENTTPLSWFSDDPTWVKIKVARKLEKPLSDVTVDDIRNHGHLALINKKDPNLTDIYRVGEEGLSEGPYSKVKTIGGSEIKAYETPIYQDGLEPFGVERNEWIATQNVEPFIQLTGDDLVKFLRIKGLLD